MSNKGSSISFPGGGGSGSGSLAIGSPVSGGTNSTLLWIDSSGNLASGVTANTVGETGGVVLGGTSSITINPTLNTNSITLINSGGAQTFILESRSPVTGASRITTSGSLDITTAAATATILTTVNHILALIAGDWFQNLTGEAALNANYTNGTAAFTNTNLSITVISGRTYNFELNLFISQSVAIDGWAIDFAGGSAAMTNFVAQAVSVNETGGAVVLANATSAALATVINATTTTTTGGQLIRVQGSFVPSGAGTFIIRARLNTLTTGVITVKRGSNLIIRDSKAL